MELTALTILTLATVGLMADQMAAIPPLALMDSPVWGKNGQKNLLIARTRLRGENINEPFG